MKIIVTAKQVPDTNEVALVMLHECIAMGADDAVLLSSRAFGGADTCATSTTVAAGIQKLGDYDIIFAGRQAIDGDTAQVAPQMAMRLGLPLVTYVQKIVEVNEKEKYVIVERQLEDGHEVVKLPLPCVLTCVKELNTPRYMTVGRILYACENDSLIKIWNEKDVELDPANCGLNASPTKVDKSFTPAPKGKGVMLSGTIQEMSAELVGMLRAKHII